MEDREALIRRFLGKTVHIVIDRPVGYCHKGILYPVNYGYLPGVIAGDGEEQDVYILGIPEPLREFDGRIIGAVRRHNDTEDKLVAAPEGLLLNQAQIGEAVHFQEQYFETSVCSLLQKSCGVMPLRRLGEDFEILLCFEDSSHSWSLPKGRMKPFESEQQTALRELREETGLSGMLLPIPPVSEEYPLRSGGIKQVVCFAAEVSGNPQPRTGEIGELRWVSSRQLDKYLPAGTVRVCRSLLEKL